MSDFKDIYDILDEILSFDPEILSFDPDASESTFINQRLATRFIRNDIKAIFYKIDIFTSFGFNFFRRLVSVELLDISSKGALISTDKKLKIDTKIILGLKFKSDQTFRIKAQVVRKSTTSDYEYGIKFDLPYNDLGDYLVKTQNQLKFK